MRLSTHFTTYVQLMVLCAISVSLYERGIFCNLAFLGSWPILGGTFLLQNESLEHAVYAFEHILPFVCCAPLHVTQ